MAKEERLAIIINTSKEPITEVWDGVEYTLEPGAETTLLYGLGLIFRDRHPEITLVGERLGIAPDVLYVEEKLINVGEGTISIMWDGRLYVFPLGKPTAIDRALAPTMIVQARANGGVLKHDYELTDGEAKAAQKTRKKAEKAKEEAEAAASAEASAIGAQPDLTRMNRKQLAVYAEDKGVEFDENATRKDLLALLTEQPDESAPSEPESPEPEA